MEKAKVSNQDEFDLVELFLKGVNIIRSNFWLITLFFAIGTVLGLAYYYSSPKRYESKMVISSTILTRSFSKELIEKLNTHRRERNIRALTQLLQVSEKTAENIAYLEIETLSQADDFKETDKFIVSAQTLSPDVWSELQQGLVHYLENNEFVKVRVEQNKKYLKQMLAKVDNEINDMEAFKKRLINGEFFQSARGNVMFDPTTVNSKILELTKERINLQNSLELASSVQVVDGFTKFERPTAPRLSVSLVSGALVGIFFVAILITFKSVRRLLRLADAAQQNQ
jgi:hypothetical protein